LDEYCPQKQCSYCIPDNCHFSMLENFARYGNKENPSRGQGSLEFKGW